MESNSRQYSWLDKLCLRLDHVLSHSQSKPGVCVERANPADKLTESSLDSADKSHSAALMRINHVGEVCAQALYQGQALTARLADTREAMQQAAQEEQDHLRWCKQRLDELDSHASYLNPLWYLGAFTLGTVAGAMGDKWSLGFVAETEQQVVQHLQGHQQKLVAHDHKSRAIIEQMKRDEAQHAEMAWQAGASELPEGVKALMRLSAKVMTATAYWI